MMATKSASTRRTISTSWSTLFARPHRVGIGHIETSIKPGVTGQPKQTGTTEFQRASCCRAAYTGDREYSETVRRLAEPTSVNSRFDLRGR